MSKHKQFEQNLGDIIRVSHIDLLMIGFVMGKLDGIDDRTGKSDRSAINQFCDVFDLSEDEYPRDSAYVAYSRSKQLKLR